MRLIKDNLNLDFMGKRLYTGIASLLVILGGIGAFFVFNGLNYGIDFRGGTIIQIQFKDSHAIGDIRKVLSESDIGSFSLQSFGEASANEFIISIGQTERTQIKKGESIAEKISGILKGKFSAMEVRRVESVGPKVGEELKTAASEAILFSLVAILIYIWFRFQWRFGVGAIMALVHDVLIVLSAFVLTQKEITLPVVAAILTVAGYSINDTIVIFDRIRENLHRFQKRDPLAVFNSSVNQTLSRTVLTSGTTLLVVAVLYFFGGAIINDFAFALLIGIIVGTYSSIFIAAPLVFLLQKRFPPKAR